MEIIDSFFEYSIIALIVINTSLFVSSYNRNRKSPSYKLLFLHLFCALIINLSVFILAKFNINNLYFSHYYFISQFVILSLFYRSQFKKAQKLIVLILLVVVLIILAIQYSIWPELYFKFNTIEVFITSFPIIVYSVIYLFNSLSKSSKYMYINTGVLIYITTSTLIFILGDYLSSIINSKGVGNIWLIK